jgi:dipeptidyl aminopeptidase/acylaminoacyl peptidase
VITERADINHAQEIYSYNLKKKTWKQISTVNNNVYNNLALSKTEKRYVTTTDGKKMLVWVVLPPNFDPNKKYPALLYCQGGPQSALTQFYSFRWNFQVMAAQGYIIVAPNRRGMPGHGVQWNEQISKDWGGQVMDDYLSAIDNVAKEPYVDKARLGAVGASYGGYSVFYLAGIHNKRFKTFISHCGVFNLQSMYGTTEKYFLPTGTVVAHTGIKTMRPRKTYTKFNPINNVDKWDTPILVIQGGSDYRVPIGQGQEAFQAAQLRGIKSRFLYFPDENHWVLKPQNAMVWQREFFRWLKETL